MSFFKFTCYNNLLQNKSKIIIDFNPATELNGNYYFYHQLITVDTLPKRIKPTHSVKPLNQKRNKTYVKINYSKKIRQNLPENIVHLKPVLNDTNTIEQSNLLITFLGGAPSNSVSSSNFEILQQYLNNNYYLDSLFAALKNVGAQNLIGHLNLRARRDTSNNGSVINSNSLLKQTNSYYYRHWNGVVAVDSSKIILPLLGNGYIINNQKFNINYPDITFNNFIVNDSFKNKLVINGSVSAKPDNSNAVNLNVKAYNFALLDVQKAIANQLYGFVAADADLHIKGNTSNSIITGDITLKDSCAITIILPQINVNKEAENSMIRFINNHGNTILSPKNTVPLAFAKPYIKQRINYNLNIKTSPRASLTFIIDPDSGDELKLFGTGILKAGMDSMGTFAMGGLYKIDSGNYKLNYQFFQKQFNILSGSNILFNGLPANALININAACQVNTASQDLLENEIGPLDEEMTKAFSKQLPFLVTLHLQGLISNPNISFTIELSDSLMPNNNPLRMALKNKLYQLKENIAATNKQVFSLLLYSRFVGEESTDFFKGSETGDANFLTNQKNESVSKFLAASLDKVAENLFKTLDVDRNLNNYRDYSNGDAQDKSDINTGPTKSFINDRLKIIVGKNYGIDGQDASAKAAQQKGLGFLPDVTLHYYFTKDGKYRYRSYKKSADEVTLDGYVTESGISFLVTLDYDKFINLSNKKSLRVAKRK